MDFQKNIGKISSRMNFTENGKNQWEKIKMNEKKNPQNSIKKWIKLPWN